MRKTNKYPFVTFLVISVLMSASSVTSVFAVVPVVTNVVVWNDGGNTVLNVTVSHSPQTSLHHVDSIEVNVSGNIQSFPVSLQPETIFTVPCDLGPIEGTPMATVRAHCTFDGYSLSWYGPIQIPEFLHSILLLILLSVASFTIVILRKIK